MHILSTLKSWSTYTSWLFLFVCFFKHVNRNVSWNYFCSFWHLFTWYLRTSAGELLRRRIASLCPAEIYLLPLYWDYQLSGSRDHFSLFSFFFNFWICGPWFSSFRINQELVENTESWVLFQNSWLREHLPRYQDSRGLLGKEEKHHANFLPWCYHMKSVQKMFIVWQFLC